MDTTRPLIARHHELQVLEECLTSARSGRARIALIRGESGIGKSRLAESLADQARQEGVFVALGHCTPVSGGELPFGPFVELLSQIGAAPESEDVAGATWERLRTVLTVSGPSSGALSPDVGLERSLLFTSVLWVLHTLGERQPVMLVLEDVHWADSSSLDLLNYLARTAGQERLLIVLTCRDDALGHDASTGRGIRELGRAEMTCDIALTPLGAEEVSQLLVGADLPLPVSQYDRVIELSDGNPFIALELASHDGVEGAHTEALRHALMGPLEDLSDDARRSLHVAAVLGEYIPHEVLEYAIESTGADVAPNIRLLTERGLLVAGAERYDFRHAIVRENVVAEMLPSERLAAHRAAVHGLQVAHLEGSATGLTQLAHHLVAAKDYAGALPVVLSAAGHARRVYAFPEARRQLAVGREVLWSRVDDPEALAGLSYDDLVRREAEMARWAGRPSEAAELIQTAMVRAAPGGRDRARLELELGEALWAAGDPAAALAAWERSEAALQVTPEDPAAQNPAAQNAAPEDPEPGDPTLRARVLASLARGLVMTGRHESGRAAAELAVALSEEAGAIRAALQARITLAIVVARQGELETGVAQLRQCLPEAIAADAFEAVVRCFGNIAFLLSAAGRMGEALEITAEGAQVCRRFGPLLLVAPTLAENWVHALVATGRWDEAEELAQELEQQWAAEGMALALHLELAHVAAARGDAASFERTMSIIERFARADDPYALHDVTAARAENLLWHGDAQEAHRIARESLSHLADQQDFGLVVSMCSVALRAHADRVTSRADRVMSESAAGETRQLLSIAQHAAERDTGALGHAHLLLCKAEAARASLSQSADPWTTVVTTWQHLDCPYPTAYAQWRRAEELFGARARAQGTRALASALQTAARLRCAPLESSLRLLARHAGVSALELETAATEEAATEPAAPAAEGPRTPDSLPVPLTPRERDVLQILTEGFSNQQIARRLFISESTVSVHVSHVIAKLGVSNRLQAAAAANRLNLFPSEGEGV